MISDPRTPAMALYPPGYPLLLAGVLALTGTAYDLVAAILPMKLLSLVLHLGATALVYTVLKRRNVTLATATALLTAVNPAILHFAAEIGTEVPYLFLSLCCLWLFEKYGRRSDAAILIGTALLLALTFYIRSIALVMVLAFVLHLSVRRRFKQALLLMIIVGVLVAPWFVRSSMLPTTGTSVGLGRGYFALYFSTDPYGTSRASLSDWIARLTQNLRIYTLDIWPDILFPHILSIGALLGPAGVIVIGIVTALLLLGFVLEARQGHVSEWYVALFFASCVGYLWAQGRLLVPIIPFAIYYFLVSIDFFLQRLPKHTMRNLAWILSCAALVLSAVIVDARNVRRNLRYGLGHSLAVYYAEDAEWSNYLRALTWIQQNTAQPVIVMCRKPDLLYILTGYQALEYPYSTNALELKRAVYTNHVAYVIEDAFSWTRTTAQYLQPALQAWLALDPRALSLNYETDPPRTRVWHVSKSN